MLARRWLLVAGALTTTAGCVTQSTDGPTSSQRTVIESRPGSNSEPSTVSVGETVKFSMYTHCGVESSRINGRVWNAVEPLYSSPEKLGPPHGWGNPEQDGRLTLESPDRAVFAALGQRVVLLPSETNKPLRPCD